jgi:hypothetical protein
MLVVLPVLTNLATVMPSVCCHPNNHQICVRTEDILALNLGEMITSCVFRTTMDVFIDFFLKMFTFKHNESVKLFNLNIFLSL